MRSSTIHIRIWRVLSRVTAILLIAMISGCDNSEPPLEGCTWCNDYYEALKNPDKVVHLSLEAEGIDSRIGLFRNLEKFDAYIFRSEFPPEMAALPKLKSIHVTYWINDSLPCILSQSESLEYLGIGKTNVSTIGDCIGDFKKLKTLSLNSKSIDTVSPRITVLQSLDALELVGFTKEQLPAAVFDIPNLTYLNLSVSPAVILPARIGNLRTLKTLQISRTSIRTLPAEIRELTLLEHLRLFENRIDTLPVELWGLTTLEQLNLSSNELSAISPLVGRLNRLQTLQLDSNRLSTLPDEVSLLDSTLETLSLRGNQFSDAEKKRIKQLLPRTIISF